MSSNFVTNCENLRYNLGDTERKYLSDYHQEERPLVQKEIFGIICAVRLLRTAIGHVLRSKANSLDELHIVTLAFLRSPNVWETTQWHFDSTSRELNALRGKPLHSIISIARNILSQYLEEDDDSNDSDEPERIKLWKQFMNACTDILLSKIEHAVGSDPHDQHEYLRSPQGHRDAEAAWQIAANSVNTVWRAPVHRVAWYAHHRIDQRADTDEEELDA